MRKESYIPPITDVEVIHLEQNMLASVEASGANVTFDTSSDFDSIFN